MSGRTIAIGDIHGCSTALAALLDVIELESEDRLVTIGDYVDKGNDSRGVLDAMIELEKRCQLTPLIGNHDAEMLTFLDGRLNLEKWIETAGPETIESYGMLTEPTQFPTEHTSFLRRCETWYETPTHIFVHASYDPEFPMQDQSESTLLYDSIRDAIPGPHVSGKTVVVGHTSQKNGEILDVGHLICIDTYCHNGGWLTALDVASGQTWQVDVNGKRRE